MDESCCMPVRIGTLLTELQPETRACSHVVDLFNPTSVRLGQLIINSAPSSAAVCDLLHVTED